MAWKKPTVFKTGSQQAGARRPKDGLPLPSLAREQRADRGLAEDGDVRDARGVEGQDVYRVRLVAAVLGALVGHERRLTVRHGRDHAEVAGRGEYVVGEEPCDRRATA